PQPDQLEERQAVGEIENALLVERLGMFGHGVWAERGDAADTRNEWMIAACRHARHGAPPISIIGEALEAFWISHKTARARPCPLGARFWRKLSPRPVRLDRATL